MSDPPVINERIPAAVASAGGPLAPFDVGTGEVAPDWRQRLQSGEPIDWFALDGDPRAVAVKANPNRRVWRVRYGDALLYVKQFCPAGLADRLRGLFRGPQARREWRAGSFAASVGVPCVALVAWGARRSGPIADRSVLITEAAAQAVPLPEAWHEAMQLDAGASSGRSSRALVDAVARLVANAHRAAGTRYANGLPIPVPASIR